MTKTFCDICEKEIRHPQNVNSIQVTREGGFRSKIVLLCDECFDELRLPVAVLPVEVSRTT